MSTTYKIKAGDTLELLSRRFYGVDNESDHILQANPGLTEPLPVGSSIVIPDLNTSTRNAIPQVSGETDEVIVVIDGKRFRYWDTVSINRSVDAISTIDLSALFEFDNVDFRNTFKPFSFKQLEVYIGNDRIFNGLMVDVSPRVRANSSVVSVSGYAKCGNLGDCTPSANSYPLEFNGVNLEEIAKRLVKPFGVKAVFPPVQKVLGAGVLVPIRILVDDPDSGPGPAFYRIECEEDRIVLDFLADLAKQRNFVITSNSDGDLVFKEPITQGEPVARLVEGESPLISVKANFSPQQYYSHITGIGPVGTGVDGGQYTITNGKLTTISRPHTYKADDSEEGDIETSVKSKMGRMFGNMVSYDIEVTGWRTPSGQVWQEDQIVTLLAPSAMIYDFYDFLIRDVQYIADDRKRLTRMNLVLPESFSGDIPKRLPWEN